VRIIIFPYSRQGWKNLSFWEKKFLGFSFLGFKNIFKGLKGLGVYRFLRT